LAEFCRVCLKEGKTKLLDRLPLCEECYDFITNEIDNNEKAEEYTARYYTTVVYPPGATPPTRRDPDISLV
jgi:hypothetical protein